MRPLHRRYAFVLLLVREYDTYVRWVNNLVAFGAADAGLCCLTSEKLLRDAMPLGYPKRIASRIVAPSRAMKGQAMSINCHHTKCRNSYECLGIGFDRSWSVLVPVSQLDWWQPHKYQGGSLYNYGLEPPHYPVPTTIFLAYDWSDNVCPSHRYWKPY